MHATERSARRTRGRAASEPIRKVVLVLEEQLAEIGDVRQADVAGRQALRVEHAVQLAEKGARRGGFAEAPLLSTLGDALRLARRLQAERRRSRDRWTVRSPAGRVAVVPAAARAEREAETERARDRPCEGGPATIPAHHGTKSFGFRESDAR